MPIVTFSVTCARCGKPFERRQSDQRNPPKFCSRLCGSTARIGQHVNKKKDISEKHAAEIQKWFATDPKERIPKSTLAARAGVSARTIHRFASEKGWTRLRKPENAWVEEEDAILDKFCHASPSLIRKKLAQKGFFRTETAIQIRKHRIRIAKDKDKDWMTITDLVPCLGITEARISRLIHAGHLKAKKHPGYNNPKTPWVITYKDVRAFIVNHVTEIDLARCDKFWLVDLLAN